MGNIDQSGRRGVAQIFGKKSISPPPFSCRRDASSIGLTIRRLTSILRPTILGAASVVFERRENRELR